MAQYRVIKQLDDAFYREIYFVDASSEEEARRKVLAGQARCQLRYFQTRGVSSGIKYKITEVGDTEGFEEGIPVEKLPEFTNGVFKDAPGSEIQTAIQRTEI